MMTECEECRNVSASGYTGHADRCRCDELATGRIVWDDPPTISAIMYEDGTIIEVEPDAG